MNKRFLQLNICLLLLCFVLNIGRVFAEVQLSQQQSVPGVMALNGVLLASKYEAETSKCDNPACKDHDCHTKEHPNAPCPHHLEMKCEGHEKQCPHKDCVESKCSEKQCHHHHSKKAKKHKCSEHDSEHKCHDDDDHEPKDELPDSE